MLDLKAKLLKAGLVTEEQVQKAETEEASARARGQASRNASGRDGKERKPHRGKKGKGGGGSKPKAGVSEDERWQRRVAELKEAPKSDQYDAIRGWVQRTRLDPVKGLPSEDAERFHFTKHDGHISWLTLEPDVKRALSEGKAGIIAFMSHNGLAHCVVPSDVARDVGQVRSDWVRHLDGFVVETAAVETAAVETAVADTAVAETAAPESRESASASDDNASDSGPSTASPPPAAT